MNKLSTLNPSAIWNYFELICQIPRPSKHEEKIIAYLEEFARANALPFKKDEAGVVHQQFPGMQASCSNCHKDNHNRQFEANGVTDCLRCHNASLWKISNFDHNKTAFKLDGKHQNVPCQKCHKQITEQNITYVLYKIKETRCESCH